MKFKYGTSGRLYKYLQHLSLFSVENKTVCVVRFV